MILKRQKINTEGPRPTIIPAKKKAANRKRVGIYARVSTARVAQLRSISAQISGLVRHVATRDDWILMDVYMDIGSAKTGATRPEFNRMLEDCRNQKLDIIATKSMSRLGRDSLESGEAVRTIRKAGVEIYFQSEETFVEQSDSELELMIRAAISQSENEHRSENIRMGLKFGAMNGTCGLYRKPCYGYRKNENGDLVPDRYQAEIVQVIFNSYLEGKSIRQIVEYLEENNVNFVLSEEDRSFFTEEELANSDVNKVVKTSPELGKAMLVSDELRVTIYYYSVKEENE